jgi:hypothetical protein
MELLNFKDLCGRLDQVAAILEIMEGEPNIVDLYREASEALNQAISEIERLRADAELHRETSKALRDALVEIERLRSEAGRLSHSKLVGDQAARPSTSDGGPTDWFARFLDRKRALTGESVPNKGSSTSSAKSRVD